MPKHNNGRALFQNSLSPAARVSHFTLIGHSKIDNISQEKRQIPFVFLIIIDYAMNIRAETIAKFTKIKFNNDF
jgi:hypothetical protein